MSENGTRAKAEVPREGGYIPRFGLDEGPVKEVHAFWLAGMSCDGCSIAAVGAKHPTVEQLITGTIPGLPKVVLHHPVLSVTAGHRFMQAYHDAKNGTLGAPYVVIQEGSVADEDIGRAVRIATQAKEVRGVAVECDETTVVRAGENQRS